MNPPLNPRYRKVFQKILTTVSDEERDELATEVHAIDAHFARLAELLSCLTDQDRTFFFEVFAVSLGDLILSAGRQIEATTSNKILGKFSSVDALICVTTLTTSLEDFCARFFADDHGLEVCRNHITSLRAEMAEEMQTATSTP